eukprot:3584602-Lingulodinium_polyedra.AAC.1
MESPRLEAHGSHARREGNSRAAHGQTWPGQRGTQRVCHQTAGACTHRDPGRRARRPCQSRM